MTARMLAAAGAALLSAAAPATAVTFDWRFMSTDGSVTASGTLTANGTNLTTIYGREAYVVQTMTGHRNGVEIVGLEQAFPTAFGGSDRYVYAAGVPFTFSGISLALADGSYANWFNNGWELFATNRAGTENAVLSAGSFRYGVPGTVPEPATWAMLIGGFTLVGGLSRRRRRTLHSVCA